MSLPPTWKGKPMEHTEMEIPNKKSNRHEKLRQNLIEPKRISVAEARNIVAEGGSVFVMNQSDRNGLRPRGKIAINIANQGSESVLMIPNTFIPVEVTNIYPGPSLMASERFLQSVDKIITLHDPQESNIYLENPDARAELMSLNQEKDSFDRQLREEMGNITVSSFDEEGVENNPDENVAKATKRITDVGDVDGDQDAVGVLWSVYEIITDNTVQQDRLMRSVRTMTDLKTKDLKFISKRARFDNVVNWANVQMSEN